MIEERDKEFSIYEVPLSLVENDLDGLIVQKLNLKAKPLDIADWRAMLQRIMKPACEVTIAVVGKYTTHHDAYKSVYESLDHAGIALAARVLVRKIAAEEVEREGAERVLSGMDGILVPGGFGDAASPARSMPSDSPVSDRCRSWEFAWAFSARPSSTRGTSWGWRMPTRPRSTAIADTRSSACSTISTRSRTWEARCGWDHIPAS